MINKYQALGEEGLWHNLQLFLEEIIPVASECHVNMGIHPGDPAWSSFGIPRLITCEKNLDRFLSLVDDPHNGLTFCTGSLGTTVKNDIVSMIS